MARAALILVCLFLSYFVVFWVLYGLWGKALMTAILGSIVFSTTLLLVVWFTGSPLWRAFWIANTALILIVGGFALYATVSLPSSGVRFGGPVFFDGHITLRGVVSVIFDCVALVLCNFIGFLLATTVLERISN